MSTFSKFAKRPAPAESSPTFTMILLDMGNGIGTGVVTDPLDPTGRGLTKEEALASPYLSLIFKINDFLLTNDQRLLPFLLGK